MQKSFSLALKACALGVIIGALSACATVTPEQLAAVESKISSAASDARNAASTANKALEVANGAAAAASAAQSAADAAMACCNDNKDRIERMFEQTMRK
ncbi:MAG: alanine-zipper protein [Pseudomonadota bacterium]